MFSITIEDIRNVLAKDSIMCPAVILAANRNESVMGRTKFLTVSIITRNGFNAVGAPDGRRCAKNIEGLDTEADKIIVNQSGNPKDREKIMCEDALDT